MPDTANGLPFPRVAVLRRFHPQGCRFEVADEVEAYRVEAYGGEETFLEQFLEALWPEDVVYDIGACVGLMTVHAALRATRVVAFEPDPHYRARLERNLALNRLTNVQVVDWAVAEAPGSATLYTDGPGGLSPSLRPTGRRGTVQVRTQAIDRALEAGQVPWPTVIKMDIEGAEILALRGMRRLLSSDRAPRALFLELHPEFLPLFDSSAEEVLALLEGFGYRALAQRPRQAQVHLCLVREGAAPAGGGRAGEQATRVSRQDLEALLRRSAERLSAYQDRHRGQRCVIIGNGPSLNRMDLSFLKRELSFGLNRIYLGFDRWDFRPTYYVAVNPLVIEQSAEVIARLPMPRFLSAGGARFVPEAEDVIFLRSLPQPLFSRDPRQGLWEGHTVTYVALQLAHFMGFEQVVLIGVDHHYRTTGPPNAEVVSEGPDPNHFHPDYFARGVRWNLPDLAASEAAYRLAKEAFEADGRMVVDATVDGRLTIFPKADYRSLFGLRAPAEEQEQAADKRTTERKRPVKVTALVSTCNSERFLRGLLEDLEAQTIADRLEIIVVDSGSEQGEEAIVREFQDRYDNIVYLRTERETLYAAWNRAIHLAQGEYLTVANTDDRHRPDALERMARALDEYPEVALVYADSLKTRQPNRPFGQAEVSGAFRWPDFDPDLLLQACYIGPQPMWRRSLHERHGLFNPAYRSAGDYEFWLRLARAGERFLHLPEALGLYYDNPEGIEHSDQALNEAEAELARARHWPPHRPRRPLRVTWQREVGLRQALVPPTRTPTRAVNICLVTYNRLAYTRQVFEALERNPPGCPHVITVVDNGSSDGTAEWLREQAAAGRIKNLFLLPENIGVSRAQNLAWAAEPDLHYLKLDNDMLPQWPNWLLPMVLLAETLPQVGAVAYNVEPVTYPLTILRGWPVRVKGQGNLGGACLLIPHRVHAKVGFWCEDYGLYGEEDLDMGFRLRCLGLLNVYMADERAFFHLPTGRAARIDSQSLQALDGGEDPAYRRFKDEWRRRNVRQRVVLERNLSAYRGDPARCYLPRGEFDGQPFQVQTAWQPAEEAVTAHFDLEDYTLETACRLHDQGDLEAAMVCFAWLGALQTRRRLTGGQDRPPGVAFYGTGEPSGRIRLGLAAEALRGLGYRVHVANAFAPQDADCYDLFVFSRPHLNPAVYAGLKAVALRGKPLLVDLDDLFHQIPPDHPGYHTTGPGNPQVLSLLESILQLATWLIVATPQLAEFYRRWAPAVSVIPNGWSRRNARWLAAAPPRQTVTLGWAGTLTHRQDVLLMRPGVMRALREHPQACLVIGGDPEVYWLFSGLPERQRRFVPWMDYEAYPGLLAEFDILLSPLRDTAFNRAKSDIKLVEAGVRRIPWVASPSPAYRAWGVGGLLAETERDWYRHLSRLVTDLDLRRRLGEEGHRKALEREAQVLARHWVDLFAGLGFPPPERPSLSPEDEVVARPSRAAQLLAEVLESQDVLAALEARRPELDGSFLDLVEANASRARQEGDVDLAEGLEALAQVVRQMLGEAVVPG